MIINTGIRAQWTSLFGLYGYVKGNIWSTLAVHYSHKEKHRMKNKQPNTLKIRSVTKMLLFCHIFLYLIERVWFMFH